MTCEECVNVIRRVKVDNTVDTVCCLDGRAVMYVVKCSKFKGVEVEVPVVPVAVVKQGEVIDLGYGAVEKKRGRQKGWRKKF